jgi:hypothetical protein
MGGLLETSLRNVSGRVAPYGAELTDLLVVGVRCLAILCVLAVEWRAWRTRRATRRAWCEWYARTSDPAAPSSVSSRPRTTATDSDEVLPLADLAGTDVDRTARPSVPRDAPAAGAALPSAVRLATPGSSLCDCRRAL